MPKVKNVSGQDLFVPALGRAVLNGQVVDVPEPLVKGLAQQAIWDELDEESGGNPDPRR